MKAKGEFEVDLKPIDSYPKGAEGITLGRTSINKSFHGDLEAKSIGEMLNITTDTEGSAGYVAIEHVKGALQGKTGTFVLQHFGITSRGKNRLILEVVPDSGSGQLVGLSGKMTISIVDGKHRYQLDYSLD